MIGKKDRVNEDINSEYSVAYFIYTFVIGTALIIAFSVLGYKEVNIFYAVFIGALFQTIYRVLKRFWQRKLTGSIVGGDDEEIEKNHTLTLVLIYVAMCVVTLMWYGFGLGLNKLIN
ncbi:hypothetical protein [Pleionea sediminis]|uniref:hypothetical protein n=1 Tax=Pleionea sediminis TaxID=2569479 RepID=UPI001185BCD5|nr:hypothetical protein [Pleionea sediminis]